MWVRDRLIVGEPITHRTEAEREADRPRSAIRERTLQAVKRQRLQAGTLTLEQLVSTYQMQMTIRR